MVSGGKGAAAKREITRETSERRHRGGGFEGWMKIPPCCFPFVVSAFVLSLFVISNFGVFPFVFSP